MAYESIDFCSIWHTLDHICSRMNNYTLPVQALTHSHNVPPLPLDISLSEHHEPPKYNLHTATHIYSHNGKPHPNTTSPS
jgi:hypothetical protein